MSRPYRQIRRRRMRELTARFDGRCYYCLVPFSADERPTRDHWIPRCQGGSKDEFNIVPACSWCNVRKANKTEAALRAMPEFQQRLAEVLATYGRATA